MKGWNRVKKLGSLAKYKRWGNSRTDEKDLGSALGTTLYLQAAEVVVLDHCAGFEAVKRHRSRSVDPRVS